MNLTKLEKKYLRGSKGRFYVNLPKNSPTMDSLHSKRLIEGFGFVVGRYATHNLTREGVKMVEQLTNEAEAVG